MSASTNGDTESPIPNSESPYIKELQKNIRNINKKLASGHKTDAIIAEHSNISLDQLVAEKKINADQKAAALKKPQLQAQLVQLEEQVQHYRKFEAENQSLLSKQKEELSTKHATELEKVKEESHKAATEAGNSGLRSSLLVFSQFLRAAAAKRSEEENADTEESKAFEGVLLLVYGGDQASVDAALKIIEGSDDKAPSIDGAATTVSYAQIKQASIEHSPFQTEEAWIDSVAEAQASTITAGTDPTLVNAGLNEQQDVLTNGLNRDMPEPQPLTETSNAAADRWDSKPVSGATESSALEESYEVIPRPDEEVDVPAHTLVEEAGAVGTIDSTEPAAGASWDDQVPAYAAPISKPAGEADGFQEVAGRSRGGRGRGGFHRGDGEHRGRGRGRGRGGFGGRGRGDGEGRGRGGRGRGPRGDGPPRA